MGDTLVIDTLQLGQWQAQQDFDYNRELAEDGMSLTEWLLFQAADLWDELFGDVLRNSVAQWTLAALGVVVVGLVGWYFWRFHPGLFLRPGKDEQEQAADEDTIYGIDFNAAVCQALGREDYREAVRMVYLQTLKSLSDARLIDWQPFKTPSQYVRELSATCSQHAADAAAAAFQQQTHHFLLVRYGNFPATRPLYDQLRALQQQVLVSPANQAATEATSVADGFPIGIKPASSAASVENSTAVTGEEVHHEP